MSYSDNPYHIPRENFVLSYLVVRYTVRNKSVLGHNRNNSINMWMWLSSWFRFVLFRNPALLYGLFWLLYSCYWCSTLGLGQIIFWFFVIFRQRLIIRIAYHVLQIIRVDFHILVFLYLTFWNYIWGLQINYTNRTLYIHISYHLVSFAILNLNYLFFKGKTVCLKIPLWGYMPNFEFLIESNCN